ncbi:hypothetical protein FQN55_007261 [Onygenales sp. PD_40]|nr:hypothetical protein FQN55_007261 [Onygenales sp. PD_40]KAK2778566.1 hypothetical protein FQN53_001765 [Emmonsiellopsis sp. PD_33]KAK2791710.1 hypothetical protein FQN52_004626 [Onygenales sp. PD_12]
MIQTKSFLILITILSTLSLTAAYNPNTRPSSNAVLLSSIQSLTLHANRQTTHRRVPAIPQLTCIGPSSKICALYTPPVIRCTNQGHDYDEDDIQWTCTAQLPEEFKLGSTDVVCEGYRDYKDPWVLKGSCGVEYRLLLTEKGEERYGRSLGKGMVGGDVGKGWLEWIGDVIFFAIFCGVFLVILAAAFGCLGGDNPARRAGRGGWGGWGGWGGGGGGGGGWDPPPPYDYQPGFRKQEPWRPGFWTGAASGAAAGYAFGRRNGSGSGSRSGSGSGWGSNRAESSRAASSRSSFSPSASTSESTGFGGTRRR